MTNTTKIFAQADANKLGRNGVGPRKAAKMIAANEARMVTLRGEEFLAVRYAGTAPSRHSNAHGYRTEGRVVYTKLITVQEAA